MNKVIEQAISICGSRKLLAQLCQVSEATVGNWLRGSGINAKYVSLIHQATNGAISIDEILQSLSQSQS